MKATGQNGPALVVQNSCIVASMTGSGKKGPKGHPTVRGLPGGLGQGAKIPPTGESNISDDFSGVEQTVISPPPFVEIELVYERGQAGMSTDDWKAVEVWTRNRIYIVDWNMRCIEVVDRKSGKPDPRHALLGAILAGGQVQNEEGMEMTFPLPRPNTEAVFEYHDARKGYVSTSTVTRVVFRLRVLTVPKANVEPTWEQLTSSHRVPDVPSR